MSAFEVNFYYKADGSCPVRDFLDTLDDKMLAKLLGTISLLRAFYISLWSGIRSS